MVHVLRRRWPFRVLALLITFFLGLQTGRMLPEPARIGQTSSGRTTTVVLKKISDSLLPAEAHAAEAPAGLVRKKLPPAPSADAVTPAPAAETPGEVDRATGATAGPVVKKMPEPPAVVVPADIKAPEEKPAEVAGAASPPAVPAVAPPPAPAAIAAAAPAAEPSIPPAAAPGAAPPRPAVAPPAPKAPSAGARNPFSLLLASCQNKRNAEAALAGYRRLGLEPYIVLTDLGPKGMWWRTMCGAYPTLEAAASAKQGRSLAHAVVVRTPYAALIEEYVSDSEAVQAAAALARKGLFPYLVKGPASVQLMAGAFPAQPAADDYRRELEALGITARTIQR